MTVDILTPDGKIFSGDVYGVQMPGVTGSMEVLEKHAPMIAALQEGKLKILKEKLLSNDSSIVKKAKMVSSVGDIEITKISANEYQLILFNENAEKISKNANFYFLIEQEVEEETKKITDETKEEGKTEDSIKVKKEE